MPSWFPTDLAETVAFVPIRIAFLVIVALLVRALVHRVIDRTVRRALRTPGRRRLQAVESVTAALAGKVTGVSADRRNQRLSALASLGRSITTVIIFFTAAIMVLNELGFNVATIIAGTSIAGVTIAFGMQNVVKDFVSGVFMLIEDQLGVGDFVDLDKASGTVEEIGLRVTQIRDDNGTVWYVRNGEVLRVGNFSQGGPGRPPVLPVAPTRIQLVDDDAEDDPGATSTTATGSPRE